MAIKNHPTQRESLGSMAFRGFSHIFLFVWALMVVVPMLWVVLSAFKADDQIINDPLSFIPDTWNWSNFSRAWEKGRFSDLFINTIVIVGGGVFLTMLLGSMAAYVLARFQFPGNKIIYYLFLSGFAFPVYLAAIPLFKVTDKIGDSIPILGLNSHVMMIAVYIAWSMSFTVFFMHSFFRTLPTTIAEAAYVDGASHTKTFFKVMLPMAKPGLISIGIFNVIGQWNQWYLPVLLMNPDPGQEKNHVLATGVLDLAVNQGYKSDWSGLFAGVTLAMLPVLAVYLVFQRQIQAGLTSGTLK